MSTGILDKLSWLIMPNPQKTTIISPFFNLSYLQNNYSKQYFGRPYSESVSRRSDLWFNTNDPKRQNHDGESDA